MQKEIIGEVSGGGVFSISTAATCAAKGVRHFQCGLFLQEW